MPSLLCDPPGSVQRKVWTTASERQTIRDLAYGLWQKRGSPLDSPELGWAEAERQLSCGDGSSYSIGSCLRDERDRITNGLI